MNSALEHYLELNYTIRLKRDDEGDFVARIEELDGCLAHGTNAAEALANLRAMQAAWIESCLEAGQPVPQPENDADLPSGKWVQRVPRSLHQRLIQIARRENVSLNHLAATILSEGIAYRLFSGAAAQLSIADRCANSPKIGRL